MVVPGFLSAVAEAEVGKAVQEVMGARGGGALPTKGLLSEVFEKPAEKFANKLYKIAGKCRKIGFRSAHVSAGGDIKFFMFSVIFLFCNIGGRFLNPHSCFFSSKKPQIRFFLFWER